MFTSESDIIILLYLKLGLVEPIQQKIKFPLPYWICNISSTL